jgi:L-lactate dehydrogenase (cytochrome)
MKNVSSIDDLRRIARRRVPRMFYEYVDSGSWTESTYHANETDLRNLLLRQRIGIDVSTRKLATTMLGENVSMPVALAPTGLTGMLCADGEILAARAAERFGAPFCLSLLSICSLEDVAAHTTRPFWMQVYMVRDRTFIERLLERAQVAKCSALMLTLDLPVSGVRHRDLKNGLTVPPKLTLPNLFNIASKPRWCKGMLATRRRVFGNIANDVAGVKNMASIASWIGSQFDQSIAWKDVEWVKRRWGGKLIVKGVLDPADALDAVAAGADAIVVSNHGGRQLDGTCSTIRALPAVVEAVKGRVEIWLDGGIRTGQDIVKALACGASATLVGRAFLYGLAAAGEQGVTRSLEILSKDLDHTMALCGITDVTRIGPEHLLSTRS